MLNVTTSRQVNASKPTFGYLRSSWRSTLGRDPRAEEVIEQAVGHFRNWPTIRRSRSSVE